jgi:sarcosine oxidase subunit beta
MLTIPALRKARVLRVWSGFYEVTPDHSHILGRGPQWPENLYIAAGFSGHGLLMAPFAGEAMADLLLDGRTTPLMEPFRPSRFEEGKQINEALVIG